MSNNNVSIIAFTAGMLFVGAHSYYAIERNGGVGIDGENRRAALAAAELAAEGQPETIAGTVSTEIAPLQTVTTDVPLAPEGEEISADLTPPPAITVNEDELLVDIEATPFKTEKAEAEEAEVEEVEVEDNASDTPLSLEEAKEALSEIAPLDAPNDAQEDISADDINNDVAEKSAGTITLPSGTLTKSAIDISGDWAFATKEDALFLTMSKSFTVKTDAALIVMLSTAPFVELTDKNATSGALAIGVIVDQSGTQTFPVPDGVDLEIFQSLVIYDDEADILIGGSDL